MKYYMDGNVALTFDFSSNQYFSQNKSLHINMEWFELDIEQKNHLIITAFKDISSFYNQFDHLFLNLQEESGINIWFLEYFRLFQNYKNYKLKLAHIAQFLKDHPSGEILTTDTFLTHYFPAAKYHPAKKNTAKKRSLLKEFKTIFRNAIKYPTKKSHSKNILISSPQDFIHGFDKRFGALNNNSEILINRELFINHQVPSEISPRVIAHSDRLFFNSLFKFKLWNGLWVFKKSITNIKNTIGSATLTTDQQLLHHLFWQNQANFSLGFIRFQAFNNFFKKLKSKNILLSNENSPQQKVIQYAAKQNQHMVYAFQHGLIDEIHSAYMYGAYHNKPMLPDITFTWGLYFTELLINKGGYDKKQCLTVGKITPLKPPHFLNSKIDKKKEVIVYATQPQPDKTQMSIEIAAVLETFKQLSGHNYQLVLRPHPLEKSDTYFDQIAAQVNFHDFLIDRTSTLNAHFEIASALITSFSTVGLEFIPYYKPLLILNFTKNDRAGYIAEGVGINLENKTDLLAYFSAKSHPVIDKNKYNSYLKKYLLNTGEATIDRIEKALHGHH
ncbi:hypothetical protein DNU06_01140 [Putridiphycobacter roseus]|uniref:Uncharacterized protein n=1 Tax=Putridiphycobacter roseus TaxID=2219161 RepID=A0A2W1NUM2_9FLAO|nr:CDP-glycerol glycerophosphotransferase family protein [Putridiphycobacter roseus]PZE18468.1 hypothetical protein DNU06_01140 [Putridiphycobacter roseus]